MKKICFIATLASTLKAFVLPAVEYIMRNTDWKVYVICDRDESFVSFLPAEVTYIPIPMKRGISLAGIRAMLQMVKAFKREKFDLVQYSTPNAALYASLAGKLAGVPVRLYCQWGMVYVGMSGLKRKVFKLEEKLVCSLSTWIEPDSKSNLEFAHKEGLYPQAKGSVIGKGSACGVNFEKFNIVKKMEYRSEVRSQCGIPADAYGFGFVGRITRDKGIDELLSAFKRVWEEDSSVYLLLVGRIEKEELLDQELYEWSQSCNHVIYVGRTEVVEQYLSAMDCYVLPSYREGFGMGTIEAEAMGVPVIVTDIPGPIDAMIPDVTGKVVKKADVETLYQAMREMKDCPEESFGEKGYEFVRDNFAQEKLLEKILEDRKHLLGVS